MIRWSESVKLEFVWSGDLNTAISLVEFALFLILATKKKINFLLTCSCQSPPFIGRAFSLHTYIISFTFTGVSITILGFYLESLRNVACNVHVGWVVVPHGLPALTFFFFAPLVTLIPGESDIFIVIWWTTTCTCRCNNRYTTWISFSYMLLEHLRSSWCDLGIFHTLICCTTNCANQTSAIVPWKIRVYNL